MYVDNIRHNESDNSRAISDAAREANTEKFRVLDLDQYGYCQKCLQVIYITEATSARTEKSTLMTRHLAKQLGAVAIFIRHEWEDFKHEFPIFLAAWKPDGSKWQPATGVERTEWNSYKRLIENTQKLHEKETGCSGKKAPYFKSEYDEVWFSELDYEKAARLSNIR